MFRQLMTLHRAGIAHGSLSAETIVVDDDGGAGFVDFRAAVTGATEDDLHRDMAAALAAVRWWSGRSERWHRHARSVPPDLLVDALPFLQRAALDPAASKALRGKKAMLTAVREQGAVAAGVEVPKLIEPRRISWVTLVLVVGTLIGGWALIGVLINVGKSWSTITGAKWGWVVATFVLAQAAYPAIATTTVGSVTSTLPYGRTVALEVCGHLRGPGRWIHGDTGHPGPVLPARRAQSHPGRQLGRPGQHGQLDRQGCPVPHRPAAGHRIDALHEAVRLVGRGQWRSWSGSS